MIRYQRVLPAGLLAISFALCWVVALEIYGWEQNAPTSPAAARITIPNIEQRSDALGTPNQHEVWLNEILSRPLFSPNRRPAEAGASRGLPRLTGIVVNGSQKLALFAGPSNERPIVAQAGSHVGAYDVQAITDAGVTVVGPEGVTLIRPIFDANRPAAAPVPAGTRQPAASRPAAR